MADASAVRAHLIDFAGQIFDKACDTIHEKLVEAAPPFSGANTSGETKRQIKITNLSSAPVFAAFAESPTPQGQWQEEGTSPHRIEGNPLLAFEWNGKLTIVHSVNHPGNAAHPWFHPTLEAEWPNALADAASVAN